MARFTAEQAAAVISIQQVINEWGGELDRNSGRQIAEADVLTQDVHYFVGGQWRDGIAATAQFYRDRWASLTAGDGPPVMRHLHCNLRVRFNADDHASADFQLLFFAKVGEPPFVGYADPLAVADVWMDCRREADGHWRIARFESRQVFQRG